MVTGWEQIRELPQDSDLLKFRAVILEKRFLIAPAIVFETHNHEVS